VDAAKVILWRCRSSGQLRSWFPGLGTLYYEDFNFVILVVVIVVCRTLYLEVRSSATEAKMDPQTPMNHKASQETLISLLQLDPQPIESPSQEKPLPALPEGDLEDSALSPKSPSISSTPSQHSSAVGLSGSSHGLVYYCSISEFLH
jgi:hypothetical protein